MCCLNCGTNPKPNLKPLSPGCEPYHDALPDLGYMTATDDAEDRMARGEKQVRCPGCCKWVWSSFFHHLLAPDVTRHLGGGHYEVVSNGELAPNPAYRPAK